MTYSPPDQTRMFNKSYRLEFLREVVYAAWISEATVIPRASRMEISPKQGGAYRLIMGNDVSMEGCFSEVVPNQRLIYSGPVTMLNRVAAVADSRILPLVEA